MEMEYILTAVILLGLIIVPYGVGHLFNGDKYNNLIDDWLGGVADLSLIGLLLIILLTVVHIAHRLSVLILS